MTKYCGEATLEDIKPGVKLWHSYGDRMGGIEGFTVMAFPVTGMVLRAHEGYNLSEGPFDSFCFEPIWILGKDDNDRLVHHSLGDCGLGERVYNQHRLFLSESDAYRHNESFWG